MLPPETLPPGDPSGGVVYLRNEILSLQKALCLFLNMDVLQGGVVSTSPNPLSWRTMLLKPNLHKSKYVLIVCKYL